MKDAEVKEIEKSEIKIVNSPKSKIPNTFRALKHRNFRLFFAGQFISLTGTWMQSVAQSWLVYRLTGSVVLLGLLGFASQIPVFLIAPFGGAVCILGSLLFALRLPYLREEGRQMIVAMQMTAGVPASKASFQPPTLTSEREALPKS